MTPHVLEVDGLTISAVDFYPDEGFPLCVGYMVGEDDGKTTLYATPRQAVDAYRAKAAQADGSP